MKLNRLVSSTTFISKQKIPLTSDIYPNLKRNPKFKVITESDISFFGNILQKQNVLTATEDDPDALLSYNMDWMKKYCGNSRVVLRPTCTEQVSQILKYCHHEMIAAVPQGGNTGLVGGSVAVFDEVVISTQMMNSVKSFDPVLGVVVCDAGMILEKLDIWLRERDHMCPLDLGAKGSCHIGGNVATNAGGLRLLRYGNLHGTVLGIEAVLADGTVLNNLSKLRKDNTGLDLKQLFVGSEGTLGIITAVSLLTPRKPSAVNVAMLIANDFESVCRVFGQAKSHLGEILSAFEFWDSQANTLVLDHLSHVRNPFPDASIGSFHILIETQGSNADHDIEKLSMFLEQIMQDEIVIDGALAQDETQALNMWAIREGIPESCSKQGAVYKYDISLPVPKLYELVTQMKKRLSEANMFDPTNSDALVKQVVGYGHMGDGNLHLNIVSKKYDSNLTSTIEPFVYEWTEKYQGSISAEHGIGLMKSPYLKHSKSKEMIEMMKRMKQVFDPNGILNPYKYLPN